MSRNPMTIKAKMVGMTKSGAKAAHLADQNVHGVAIWNLSVLIVPDGKFWFAQGLEINYGAQGDTVEEAKENFQNGLLATINKHLEVYGSIDKILKFAPSEILKEAAQHKASIKRFAQVSFYEILGESAQLSMPFDGIDFRVLGAAA